MTKTAVINAVGLTPSLIGEHMPRLREFASTRRVASIMPPLPAVTCTVQSTYLTGKMPSEHGIVGNGWYFRDECEIKFWKQSNKLVAGEKIWDRAKQIDPSFTCANICWWYAMYSSADYTVTPRPMYPADGRKIPDIWTHGSPTLRASLQGKLGQFPLFNFWGPATSIESTRWIADAAIEVDLEFNPTLSLIYLPHLDYNLQRFGPNDERCKKDLAELDLELGKLIDHFTKRKSRILILSEYGIVPVTYPIHINRILRDLGMLNIRKELGREILDAGASKAFAVADHQMAHVYVNDPSQIETIARELKATAGVAKVYGGDERSKIGLDHPRSGELIVLSERDAWFTYYYWEDDALAPDFARTVDIHRKPGYDPVELFIDANISAPKLQIGWKLLRRKLGFRSLLDVIGLDASLVRGSHGLAPGSNESGPLLIGDSRVVQADSYEAVDIFEQILKSLTTA
jgi:predicted AlkP superfamily pyrophosphatase or phosphodiesterase